MKVLKCCAYCNGLKNGVCCCSLPDSCHEYVDIPDDASKLVNDQVYTSYYPEAVKINNNDIIIRKSKTYSNSLLKEQKYKIKNRLINSAMKEMQKYLFNGITYKINSYASETSTTSNDKSEFVVLIFMYAEKVFYREDI